ncbi:MAG TPA: TolC family protein [Nitrospirota bacterium]|nr:TolC family protein [Nitrospirota bacterium]
MRRLTIAVFFFVLFVPAAGLSLTLEEGLQIVETKGRDVKIARSDEEVARGAVSLARSPWLPSVDLYGNETWLQYQPQFKFGPNVVPTSQDRYLTYGVRASQLLYDFGKTSSSIDAAAFGLQAREIETLRAKNRSALEFIIAYLDLLESEKLLQVAAEEVKQYEAHKQDALVRYDAGVVTKNDVLQADVTLADSRQRYLTFENLRSVRASHINSLLLRPLNEAVQPEEVRKSPSAGISLEAAWTVAEAESPEIRVIDAGIRSKEESIKATQAEYLPSFYLSGGYEYQENQYVVNQSNWSLIAGVNINLSSGGASSAKIHIGKSELASLRITRDKIVDAVRLDVQEAYLNLQTSAQKIEVTKTAVAQAEENLRLQRLRYQEGVGTAIELLDAVTLLTAARTNTWSAQYGFERAEAGLLYSMGKDLLSVYGK